MSSLDATGTLRVVEGQDDIILNVTHDDPGTEGEVIVVYLTSQLGKTYAIGEATARAPGEETLIPVTFDVPPVEYDMEVGPQDKSLPSVFPESDETATVEVYENRYHD